MIVALISKKLKLIKEKLNIFKTEKFMKSKDKIYTLLKKLKKYCQEEIKKLIIQNKKNISKV